MKLVYQPSDFCPSPDPITVAFFWRSKEDTLLKVDITAEDGDGNNVAANPGGSFSPPFSPATPPLPIPTQGNLPDDFSESDLFKSALVVYYRDVIKKVDGVPELQDFDIKFNLPYGLTGVQWSQKSGPSGSGTLIDADKPKAIFRNPTKGGLYEFELSIGGNLMSTFQVWLPMAGPEIKSEVQDEIDAYFAWVDQYNANATFSRRMPVLNLLTRSLDYAPIAGSIDYRGQYTSAKSPSGFPIPAGLVTRHTIEGYVVDAAKFSNLMVALLGREMTRLTENWLIAEFDSRGTPDDEHSVSSYRAGFMLSRRAENSTLKEAMDAHGLDMQHPVSWNPLEWPSVETQTGGSFNAERVW